MTTFNYLGTRCQRLNDSIKKLILATTYTYEPEPIEDYDVRNNTLYTISGDEVIGGDTVKINSGRASESDGTIIFS